ncbi:MAG: nuclear transport factor 2 family protein [Candidatus Binataceae bacterium]
MKRKPRKPAKSSKSAKLEKRTKAVAKPKMTRPATVARAASRRSPKPKASAQNLIRDREQILAVSKMWWDANRTFSIPMMCEAFVGGDKFHGFNLNGHTYYAIGEWVQLWEYLGHVMGPASGSAAMSQPRDVRLEIRGDMAFLTAESTFTVNVLPTSDAQSAALPPAGQVARIPFRATEVFVREDHEGNPVWKMWHFHCSPHAPEGEPRMGF